MGKTKPEAVEIGADDVAELDLTPTPPPEPTLTLVKGAGEAHESDPQELVIEGTDFLDGMEVRLITPAGNEFVEKADVVSPTTARVRTVLHTAGAWLAHAWYADAPAGSNAVKFDVTAPPEPDPVDEEDAATA